MDLRAYYKKLRDLESQIPAPYVVIVSVATSEGGKGGILTEVARVQAAKQILEGRARLADSDESNAFHSRNEEARQTAEQAAAVSKMQFVIVPAKSESKGKKE